MTREEWVAVLRDEVRYIREHQLCAHGVPPTNCEHHRPDDEEETSDG